MVQDIERWNPLLPGYVWVHNIPAVKVLPGDRIRSCYARDAPNRNKSWEGANYTLGENLSSSEFIRSWSANLSSSDFIRSWAANRFSVQRVQEVENEFGVISP